MGDELIVSTAHRNAASSRLSGVAYNPFRKGAASNIKQDIDIMLRYTNRIRLYGTDGDVLQQVLNAVASRPSDVQIYAGIYYTGSEQSYRNQLNELLAAVKANSSLFKARVKAVVVGNEGLLRKEVSEATIIARIREVREKLRAANALVPVTTAEPLPTYSEALVNAVDIILPNLHPYFDGVAIQGAVNKVIELMDIVKKRDHTGRKPIVIGEVGWPFQGKKNQNAVPSPENARQFINAFAKTAAAKNIGYFYFEAFDATWKAPGEFGVEQSWGIYSADRTTKVPGY
ncbi:glycoside hydrolase superfamily [Syncephalis fuscata]|nr:glycoside hydrolase superfamily [Syncephalis fuscata]